MIKETTSPIRLNWIDWAKAFAITFVVFGHIPEVPDAFLVHYITFFHMPLFFFISGYLTKKEQLNKQTLKKYYTTLIIPYFCFNIMYYPYWVARHVIENPHSMWYDYLKPIIGTFMLQYDTAYFESLNGVTWYIAALLVMKIITAICNSSKIGDYILFLLATLATFFYILNEQELFVIYLPTIGFTKCLPFFFIGYKIKDLNTNSTHLQKNYGLLSITFIGISLILFAITRNTTNYISYGLGFWATCISAIIGVLCLCKELDIYTSVILVNISIGTIVIMGLHGMLIGITNFTLSKLLHIDGIQYPWYISIFLSLLFVALLYPVIILFKKKYPFVLGKRQK